MAAVGRFSGGAGYVALAASAAMGALSGTGPSNAAAVGVITIPTMKRADTLRNSLQQWRWRQVR